MRTPIALLSPPANPCRFIVSEPIGHFDGLADRDRVIDLLRADVEEFAPMREELIEWDRPEPECGYHGGWHVNAGHRITRTYHAPKGSPFPKASHFDDLIFADEYEEIGTCEDDRDLRLIDHDFGPTISIVHVGRVATVGGELVSITIEVGAE